VTLLWFDELATVHLARLSSFSEIWRALASGADANPPAYYAVMSMARAIFGEGQIASRLPSILAFWVMAVCAFRFAGRRCSARYGLIALLFPFATPVFEHAFEARPYAFVGACCGAAMVCWQLAADGRRRAPALSGLAISLALAVSFHYYAAFLLFPLAAGEVARWWRNRRLDFAVLAALVLGAAPLLAWAPLVLSARRLLPGCGEWGSPAGSLFLPVVHGYADLLQTAALPGVALLCLMAWAAVSARERGAEQAGAPYRLPPAHEWVALGALSLLPVAIYAPTLVLGFPNTQLARYAIAAVFGLGVLSAWLIRWATVLPRAFGAAAVAVLAITFLVVQAGGIAKLLIARRPPDSVALLGSLPAEYAGLPVVLADSYTSIQTVYYAPKGLAARLLFLDAGAQAASSVPDATRCLETLGPWSSVSMRSYRIWAPAHPRFLLCGLSHGAVSRMSETLREDGRHLTPLARTGDTEVFLVSPGEPAE
jgi:hypothetical protein